MLIKVEVIYLFFFHRYVFFLDPCNIDLVHQKIKSIALCVSACPRKELKTLADIQKFAETNGMKAIGLFCSYFCRIWKKPHTLAELKMKYVLRNMNTNNVLFSLSQNITVFYNMIVFNCVCSSLEKCNKRLRKCLTMMCFLLLRKYSDIVALVQLKFSALVLLKYSHLQGASESCAIG